MSMEVGEETRESKSGLCKGLVKCKGWKGSLTRRGDGGQGIRRRLERETIGAIEVYSVARAFE